MKKRDSAKSSRTLLRESGVRRGPSFLVRALIQQRHDLGLTQYQVAQRLRKVQSTISDWELGAMNPSLPSLVEWAAVLDLAVTFVPLPDNPTPLYDSEEVAHG